MTKPCASFLAFFLYFLFVNFYGQINQDFYPMAEKAMRKIYFNPQEAIVSAQNLELSDKNPEHKVVLQYIISQANLIKGDYAESVKSSIDKLSISPEQSTRTIQNFLDLSLAEQYQSLGLYRQSLKLSHQNLNILAPDKEKNFNNSLYISNLLQLQARTAMNFNDFPKALELIRKNDKLFPPERPEPSLINLENSIIEIIILIHEQQLGKARAKAENTINYLKKIKDLPFLQTSVEAALARIYFLQKDYPKAIGLLQDALKKIENKGYLPMETSLYNALAQNYFALNDLQAYRIHHNLYLEKNNKLNENKKDGIRYLTELVNTHNQNLAEGLALRERKKLNTGILAGLAIILLFGGFAFKEFLAEKALKKQLAFIHRLGNAETTKPVAASSLPLEQKTVPLSPETSFAETDELKEIKKKTSLSKETEVSILEKLREFETSEKYMDNSMSLAVLSGQFDTNTKYLSEVINTYKGKNFNAYINELRIHKIAYLLKTKTEYRTYKIAYLAEICGFSSHSNFATVFKTVTGMSPNTFISQLNQK